MALKGILIICILLLKPLYSESNSIMDTGLNKIPNNYYIATGISLLGLEFVGLPLLDIKYNYRKIPQLDNPFKFICENEPYIQDELWHFVGASALAELNYRILERYFYLHEPYFLSSLLNIGFWTGMECLDALSGSGFSVRDECGNILGTLFSLTRIKYPDFPLKVRIGIKNIKSFNSSVQKAITGSIHHQLGKQYDFMKVELIYTIPVLYLYTGIAVSRTGDKEDQYGITAGVDIVDFMIDIKDGWWNKPLRFANNHFSMSFSFTLWMN